MATRSQNLGFVFALALGGVWLWTRAKAASAPAGGITTVTDSSGNVYYLDAQGTIVGARDATGAAMDMSFLQLPTSADPGYYPPGSLQSVYL